MFNWKIFFLLCSIVVIGETKFVDTLKPCAIADNECQRIVYEKVIQRIARTGIEEYGIPQLDPLRLQNVSVTVLGLVDLELVEGVTTGIKDCILSDLVTDIEKRSSIIEATCDITVKGHYRAKADSPLIKSLFGRNGIIADGNGEVKLQKLRVRFYHTAEVFKDAYGEVYIHRKKNGTTFTFDLLGKVSFAANGIYVGGQDISNFVVEVLNGSGKFILRTFGKPFIAKALEFVHQFTGRFFDVVPAKYFYTDDLTSYIDN